MRLEIAAMDPLLSPTPCLLCGERFELEGCSEGFRPELLPGVPAGGFAPAIIVEGRFVGFVCPGCFGDDGEDLARRSGASGRLRYRLWRRSGGRGRRDGGERGRGDENAGDAALDIAGRCGSPT